MQQLNLRPPKKYLVSARIVSDPCVGIFSFFFFLFYLIFFWAMKRCPIASKLAGSIGILLCCVLMTFSHMGMNACPIVRPLLATILMNGTFGLVPITTYTHIFAQKQYIEMPVKLSYISF